MKLHEMLQWGWGYAADNLREGGKKYGTAQLNIEAVIQSQNDEVTVVPAMTSFVAVIETLDIDPRISQMPQGSSQPGSSHMRLGSTKSQSHKCIAFSLSDTGPNLLPINNMKPIEPVSFYPCTLSP